MAGLMDELISGVLKSAMGEILKKSHGKTTTKRTRRKTTATTTARAKAKARPKAKSGGSRAKAGAVRKPAKRQVSRRRTTASRAKSRQR